MIMMTSDLLLKIYMSVTQPKEVKYTPIRKHYNVHLFG